MPSPLMEVFAAVLREVAFQRAAYPPPDADGRTSLAARVAVLEEELLECRRDAVKGSARRPEALREMLQVAAVACAALVDHGVCERNHAADLLSRSRDYEQVDQVVGRLNQIAAALLGSGLGPLLLDPMPDGAWTGQLEPGREAALRPSR